MTEVTRILSAIDQGDAQAAEKLLPLVYDELRRLAAQKLSHEMPGQTLPATALVHEAYIRLVGGDDQQWSGRGHFFAAAAEAMRRILIENARQKQQVRRGGGRKRVDLSGVFLSVVGPSDDLIALNEAHDSLADEDQTIAELVKLHYFGGLTIEQAAETMGISHRTGYRHWAYARSWLALQLQDGQDGEDSEGEPHCE